MWRAAGHESFAIPTSEEETDLLFAWNDGDALRRLEQLLWDCLVRRTHNCVKGFFGVLDPGDVITST